MSGEPKTLTPQAMTLKEAAERVAEKSDYLLARGEDGWGLIKRTVLGWDSEGLVWDDWEDAASFALGVRVVARDEADELRAAVLDWWQARTDLDRAYPAWIRDLPEGESYAKYMAAAKEIGAKQQRVWDELREWARRLAGGESEK